MGVLCQWPSPSQTGQYQHPHHNSLVTCVRSHKTTTLLYNYVCRSGNISPEVMHATSKTYRLRDMTPNWLELQCSPHQLEQLLVSTSYRMSTSDDANTQYAAPPTLEIAMFKHAHKSSTTHLPPYQCSI